MVADLTGDDVLSEMGGGDHATQTCGVETPIADPVRLGDLIPQADGATIVRSRMRQQLRRGRRRYGLWTSHRCRENLATLT